MSTWLRHAHNTIHRLISICQYDHYNPTDHGIQFKTALRRSLSDPKDLHKAIGRCGIYAEISNVPILRMRKSPTAGKAPQN